MPSPAVSVVMIGLNGERFIAPAIEGVLHQTFTDWELLIVDDGSTDGSMAIATRFEQEHPARIRLLTHPNKENRGMSASRNLGVRHARGEWIALLDCDDVWKPEHLETLRAAATAHPEADVLYGPALTWFSWDSSAATSDFVQEAALPEWVVEREHGLAEFYLRHSGAVPCPSAQLIRRATYEALGGFEEAFRGMCEDQVWALKAALGARVHMVDTPTLLYRRHPDACCDVSIASGTDAQARLRFITWARAYVRRHAPGRQDFDRLLRTQAWHARRSYGIGAALTRLARRVLPGVLLRRMRTT